jgi:hypothetical protein
MFAAIRAQRRELGRQLEQLEERRSEIAEQLRDPMTSGADRAGLEHRVTELDQRITGLEQQIAGADAQMAQSAGVPGAVGESRPQARNGPPDVVFMIPVVFTIFVLCPIAIAYARRLWRRGTDAVVKLPAELTQRLAHLEQAVDSVAVEIERISEGQRFVAKVFSERDELRSLGQGAAQPVEVPAADPVRVGRSPQR